MSKKLLSLVILAIAGCVTINIYFPAEEVKSAADQIVGEVWGTEKPATTEGPRSSLLSDLVGPSNAHAQTDINVSTPRIQAIKQSLKTRAGEVKRELSRGAIGIGRDGYLKVRSEAVPDLAEQAKVRSIVAAENEDRRRLYEEIAKANGFPDKVREVQGIFAASWREQAEQGWYIEGPGGQWTTK